MANFLGHGKSRELWLEWYSVNDVQWYWHWLLPGSFGMCGSLHLSLSPVLIQVSWITSNIRPFFSGAARVTKQSNYLSFKSRVSYVLHLSIYRSYAVGIDIPPFSIDPSWWVSYDQDLIELLLSALEYSFFLVLYENHTVCSYAQHPSYIVSCKDNHVLRYIPRNVYCVHTNSYQANRVTSPLGTACPV